MSITLHDKYSDKIAAAYSQESFIKARLSSDYDFNGVRTVKISTPVTVPMNDYTRSGANRYGTPAEMGDTVQELRESVIWRRLQRVNCRDIILRYRTPGRKKKIS